MEVEEEMNPFLFNLPTEIIQGVVAYLSLSDRKNLRLTCKWLYELCNSDHFCRNEKIIWSEDLTNQVNIQSDLCHIGRQYYNLVIRNEKLEISSILPFFENLGAKIRTLDVRYCDCFHPGSLESIIMLCENLCSFSLNLSLLSADFFTSELFSVTRPNVAFLGLILPYNRPYNRFHSVISIFPKVKKLKMNVPNHITYDPQECSSIFDDIMKSGSNLECLDLNFPLDQSIIEKSEFFEALPLLKELTIHFNHRKIISETEKWYPRCSNLVSIELHELVDFYPPEMIRLLTNAGLKYLRVETSHLGFDMESFKKLVNSQLHTIWFDQVGSISGTPISILDSRLEANKTVKNLYLITSARCPESTLTLFSEYFRGLVHLSIHFVTDSILQSVFQFQENLRSLKLGQCSKCSIHGFRVSTIAGSKYGISKLRKLEHLTIINIRPEVLKTKSFERAFSLPRLKYLRIDCKPTTRAVADTLWYPQIPTDIFKKSTELRALRLADVAVPSHETLSSLFRGVKNLNYLRYDIGSSKDRVIKPVTFINANCEYSLKDVEKYKFEYSSGRAYYDKKLDRMVILNASLKKRLHSPKVGTFVIDWIES